MELDAIIAEVKQEFKSFLTKRKELIVKLGTAYEKVVAKPDSICEEIKNVLRDEITRKLISTRDIERYCLDIWKKKTRPKNDNLSFSEPNKEKPQQQVAITTDGKSASYDEPTTISETSIFDESSSTGAENVECAAESETDNISAFEVSLSYRELQAHMASLLERGKNEVRIRIEINLSTKKVISAKIAQSIEDQVYFHDDSDRHHHR
jgi:hypothetical protein